MNCTLALSSSEGTRPQPLKDQIGLRPISDTSAPSGLAYQINCLNDYSKPYYATGKTVLSMKTPVDTFPYKQFYRGRHDSYRPIILDREAGRVNYRTNGNPLEDLDLDSDKGNIRNLLPLCFQIPVSTSLPCNDKLVPLKSNVITSI